MFTWRLTPGYFTALLIMIDLWRAIGFYMIILTAGMKNIPRELYEAATVDGAGTFQQWIHITLPQLEPVLFFVIVNCFIGAIQTYDIPWVLSNSSAVGVIGGKGAFASYRLWRSWATSIPARRGIWAVPAPKGLF